MANANDCLGNNTYEGLTTIKLMIYLSIAVIGIILFSYLASADIYVDIENTGIAGISTIGNIEIAVGGAGAIGGEKVTGMMDASFGAVYTESFATSTSTSTTIATTTTTLYQRDDYIVDLSEEWEDKTGIISLINISEIKRFCFKLWYANKSKLFCINATG